MKKTNKMMHGVSSLVTTAVFVGTMTSVYAGQQPPIDSPQADYQQTITINNTGDSQSGQFRYNWSIVSPGKNDGVNAISFSISPDHANDVYGISWFTKQPVANSKDMVYWTANYAKNNPDTASSLLPVLDISLYSKANSESYSVGSHYVRQFESSVAKSRSLDVSLDYKNQKSNTDLGFGSAIPNQALSSYHVAALPFSMSYNQIERHGNNVVYGTVTPVINLSGNKADYNESNPGIAGDSVASSYKLLRFQGGYQSKATNDGVLNFVVSGQYATNRLIPSERLSLGGLDSIRGFNEGDVEGDAGYHMSFEYYFPRVQKNQRYLAFVDQGQYWSLNAPSTETSRNDTLASCGLGWRYYGENGYTGKIDIGYVLNGSKKLDDTVKTDKGQAKVHMSVSKSF